MKDFTDDPTRPVGTHDLSIQQAANLARVPAPTANILYQEIAWYAARPGQQPTPLTVRTWKEQAAKLIQMYQDLLTLLVEIQVESLNAAWHATASAPDKEETE